MYLVFIFQVVPCLNFLPVPKELDKFPVSQFFKGIYKSIIFHFEWKVEVHVLFSACRQIEHIKSRSIIHLFTQSKKSHFILTYTTLTVAVGHTFRKRRETSTFSQTASTSCTTNPST